MDLSSLFSLIMLFPSLFSIPLFSICLFYYFALSFSCQYLSISFPFLLSLSFYNSLPFSPSLFPFLILSFPLSLSLSFSLSFSLSLFVFNPSSYSLPLSYSSSLYFSLSLPSSLSLSLLPFFSFMSHFYVTFMWLCCTIIYMKEEINFMCLLHKKIFKMGKSEWQCLVLFVALGSLPMYSVSRNCSPFNVPVYIIEKTDCYIWFFTLLEKLITHKWN